MQLELSIALTCGPESCRVRNVESGAEVEARYASAVQDRIKIRPGDLVVIDAGVEPPQAVWRCWVGTVKIVHHDRVVVALGAPGHDRGQVVEAPMAPALRGRIQPGATVFVTHAGGAASLLDVAPDGVPSAPAQLREALFPKVIAVYSAM
jgi:translation initiation factor IF-1